LRNSGTLIAEFRRRRDGLSGSHCLGSVLLSGIRCEEMRSYMSRPLITGVVLLSTLLVTISCVRPPRVTGSETAAGWPSAEETANALFVPPSPETISSDLRGEQIRLGYKIIVDTQEYGKRYIGNALTCTNCHLDAGLNPNSASFVGISTSIHGIRNELADR
jgi:hypothetical protein